MTATTWMLLALAVLAGALCLAAATSSHEPLNRRPLPLPRERPERYRGHRRAEDLAGWEWRDNG